MSSRLIMTHEFLVHAKLGLPYVLLFDQKKLSSEDIEKCLNFVLFGIMDSENMSNHSSTKKFWEVSVLTAACGRDDLFFFFLVFPCFWAKKWTSSDRVTFFVLVFTRFWGNKWTSSDVMTFKKPVLLSRSEIMVTLRQNWVA